MDDNRVTEQIIGAAIAVHRELGPGLLESTYEACLACELSHRDLKVERQKPLPVQYRGLQVDCGYRVDLLVDDQVIVELKTVASVLPIHEAQILTYLKLSQLRVGLILNFNVRLMKEGIHRFLSGASKSAPSVLSVPSVVQIPKGSDPPAHNQ
ncbi:MAG: GxxExxY protein [Sandaracinaceae bacterium]|nr:GxxExxY protein [Sandaracinaceae bacterium]